MSGFQESSILITEALSAQHLAEAKRLFIEYQNSLNVDLGFEDFDYELENLPGNYCAPNGYLVLAIQNQIAIGCCALRPLYDADHSNACEMKRLYVTPSARGTGTGRLLVQDVLERANFLGYSCVLLDTLDDMEAARGLYEELGFIEVSPFRHTPLAGAHYIKSNLYETF